MASQFPYICIDLPLTRKCYLYALDPDVTCDSIIRRFARDSDVHVSNIQLAIPTNAGTSSSGAYVYLEEKMVSDIIAKLLATTHRRSSRYQVRDLDDAPNAPVPVTEVIFGESVGRSIITQAASHDPDRQRPEYLVEMFIERRLQAQRRHERLSDHPGLEAELLRRYLTFNPTEKRLVMRIRIVKCRLFTGRPVFSIFDDNTAIGNFFITPDNVLRRNAEDRLSDLARKMEERLGSDMFVLKVCNQAANDVEYFGMIENADEVADHPTGEVLYVSVTRVGTGRLDVRFDGNTRTQLDISYHWTLARLIEEIRECVPALTDVDFYLCVGGHILSSEQRDTPLGQLLDDSHVVDVTINTSAASSPSLAPIRKLDDMNEFLRLQTDHFLRGNANRLARMSVEDFVTEMTELVLRRPLDAPSDQRTPATKEEPSGTPREATAQGKVTLEVPGNSLRLIKIFVYDAETDTEHVVDRLSVNAKIYTVMAKLQELLKRDMADYMLGLDDGGFIVDQDRSLSELGILHGCRLTLENERDFESVVDECESGEA